MRKVIGTILFVAYVIIAITVTVLLLSFNEYLCSEIGGYTLYIVKDDTLEPNYVRGDLLIIKQSTDLGVNVNDNIVLYKNMNSDEYRLFFGTLAEKNSRTGKQIVYTVTDLEDPETAYEYDSTYLIGKESNIKVVHHLGTILSILESRWGYLFAIVIVTLLLLLQELYDLFIEIKYGNTNEKESVKGSR